MTSIIKVNQIQDGGGNTIISSDGSGTFTSNLPSADNTPLFLVAKTDSDQSIPSSTNTVVTFNNEIKDTDNAFASNRFTVPTGEGGVYQFNTILRFLSSGSHSGSSYVVIKFHKNGSEGPHYFHEDINDGNTFSAGTSAILELAAGDYIETVLYTNAAMNLQANSNPRVTIFSGYKLIGV